MTPPAMDAAGFGAAFAENPDRGGGFWIVAAGIGRYPPAAKKAAPRVSADQSRAAHVGGSWCAWIRCHEAPLIAPLSLHAGRAGAGDVFAQDSAGSAPGCAAAGLGSGDRDGGGRSRQRPQGGRQRTPRAVRAASPGRPDRRRARPSTSVGHSARAFADRIGTHPAHAQRSRLGLHVRDRGRQAREAKRRCRQCAHHGREPACRPGSRCV